MDKLFSIFGDINHTKLGGADSFTDQLNCKYTVYILSLIAILSTTRVFVDEPISCFCPPQFTGSQVDYAKKICWTTNTHYVPVNQTYLPKELDPDKMVITYYQWIPLFLAFQAVLFYMPRLIWKKMSRKSGVTVSNITDACIECQKKSDHDSADKIMNYVTKYMSRFLVEFNRSYKSSSKFKVFWAMLRGNYLIELYLFIKILYIFNVLSQLFLLNAFLGNDYHLYGIDVLKKLISHKPWSTSHRFPRVTVCDFHIRMLGSVHRYSIECALPMNLFYEIIFIFLWFWFVFVAISTISSLFIWIVTSICMSYQETYVRQRLLAMEKVTKDQKAQIKRFVLEHLRRDGCFITRMVAKNSSDLIASQLICGLWDYYINSVVNKEISKTENVISSDHNERVQQLEDMVVKGTKKF